MTPDRALAEANVRAAEAWVTQHQTALDAARRALRAAVEREICALPPIAHASDYAGVVASLTAALGESYFEGVDRAAWEFAHGGNLIVETFGAGVDVSAFVDGEHGGDGVLGWTVCHSLDAVFKAALCSLAREGMFVEVRR